MPSPATSRLGQLVRSATRLAPGIVTLSFVPRRLRIPCFAMLGVFVGLAVTAAHISRAGSYLSDQPETCVNCHVMNTSYATWQRSSHVGVATCNDCHVPHDNPVSKLAFKARDGLYHSYVFTLRLEPQTIEISAGARPVVQQNCRRCHERQLLHLRQSAAHSEDRLCWECHRTVPHGRARSLAASPRVMTPVLPPPLGSLDPLEIGGRPPRAEPPAAEDRKERDDD